MEKLSISSVRDIVRRQRKAYQRVSKSCKKRILDEIEEVTGYHRELLARMLRRAASVVSA